MGDSNWFQRLTGWLSKKQEQKEPLTGSSSAMPASPKRKSNRKVTVLFVLGVVGILLILLSECNGRQTAAQPTDTTVPKVETEQLENKAKNFGSDHYRRPKTTSNGIFFRQWGVSL